ncbi:MAG: Eco57I restriction-modification methylase domain-containing protein [Candidatus Nanohalobium sp.]
MGKDKIKTKFEEVETFSNLVEFIANDLEYSNLMDPKDNIQEQDFWDGKGREVHLKNEDRTIVRIIRVEENEVDLRDIKDRIKRKGRRNQELFTVFTYVDEDGNLAGKTRFFWLNRRLSEEDVDVEYDLRYFEANPEKLEPVYIDYLDNLRVGSKSIETLEDDESDKGLREIFSIETITKRFYSEFHDVIEEVEDHIEGLDNDVDEHHYAQVLINRILFIMFIEEKEWLSKEPDDYSGDKKYLEEKYEELRDSDEVDDIWNDFFRNLFFDGLSHKGESPDIVGTVPYLNGGLFEEKEYEQDVYVEKEFFEALLNPETDAQGNRKGFLLQYKLKLSESNPSEQELVVDPEFIGRVFEMSMQQDPEERGEKGAFYTPKDITQYMSKNSIKQLLLNELPEKEEELSQLVLHHKIEDNFTEGELQKIHDELKEINVLDPAVGSGAFIIAVMEELVGIFEAINPEIGEEEDTYDLKEHMIANNLYGVDIDQAGIELCKFRTWLHLMQDLDINLKTLKQQNDKYALPNLDFKFFVGNSLSGDYKPIGAIDKIKESGVQRQLELTGDSYDSESFDTDFLNKIEAKRDEYTRTHDQDKKEELEQEINQLTEKIENSINWADTDYYMEEVVESSGDDFKWSVHMPEVMAEGGFDIVIANPPYQGGKNSTHDYISALSDFLSAKREEYNKIPGMTKDLYQKFVYRGFELLSQEGVINYITSNTFLTIGSKKPTRNILLSNGLKEITLSNENTFDATVKPAIFLARKTEAESSDLIRFNDAREKDISNYTLLVTESFSENSYFIEKGKYDEAFRKAFFPPTEENLRFFERFNSKLSSLENDWEDAIRDSETVEENLDEIRENHFNDLAEGDTTILGLNAVGGQGINTGDNEEFIAYIEGTDGAQEVKDRNENFEYEKKNEKTYKWLSRVVKEESIHKLEGKKVTEKEKENGFKTESDYYWVPLEKGFKESDVYYRPQKNVINWSEEAVEEMREAGTMRNLRYQFEECLFISCGGTGDEFRVRMIKDSVATSAGVIFNPINDQMSVKYLLGLLNSDVIRHLVTNFINNTVNVAITDIRYVPIVIPDDNQEQEVIDIVSDIIEKRKDGEEIKDLERNLNSKVSEIYGVELDE